jgi:hypothetical protein
MDYIYKLFSRAMTIDKKGRGSGIGGSKTA